MSISWELAFPIGVVILGLALAWGLTRYKTRNKSNDPVTERATKEQYSDPAGYGRKEEAYSDQVKD